MKKLNKLSDIPTWFKINKYDKSSSFELKEWYGQISKRTYLYDRIVLDMEFYDMTNIDAITIWENLIKTNPIFENNDEFLKEMHKETDCIFTDGAQESIRDFSASDLKNINRALSFKSNDSQLGRYCKNEMANEIDLDLKTLLNLRETSIQLDIDIYSYIPSNAVALTANLEASDDQLINDFKSWLKLARTSFNSGVSEKLYTYIDFEDWCEYAILPYFDLATWAKLNGNEFTKELMAEILFPDALNPSDPLKKPFGSVSRVTRETKKRSAKVFNNNAVNAMCAQVRKMTKNSADFCLQK
jgi:hypothetical protein